jgi:hypothetical protein
LLADGGVARNSSMTLIQALRGDFARMIDTHQTGCMRFRARAELRLVHAFGRILARRAAGRNGNGSQCVIDAGEKSVKWS